MNRTEATRLRIVTSACLVGRPVRYDGLDQRAPFIAGILSQYCETIPICPEEECGLGVPREIMRLVGEAAHPRLVVVATGADLTDRMQAWCREKIAWLMGEEIDACIFKSRSPSCGRTGQVKVYPTAEGGKAQRIGAGLFALAVGERFPLLPITDEGTLQDYRQRQNFLERIFVINRWQGAKRESSTAQGLTDFHRDHTFQLLAHSKPHYRALGRIAGQADTPIADRFAEYERVLAEALQILPTPAKHCNVLHHLAGYYTKILTAAEQRELSATIERYRQGQIPLLAPIALLNQYADKYGEAYLTRQYYLRPDPVETMLRYPA